MPMTRGITIEAVVDELNRAAELGNDEYVKEAAQFLAENTGESTENARSYHIWWKSEPFAMKAIARMAQFKASGERENHNSQKYYDILERMKFDVRRPQSKSPKFPATDTASADVQNEDTRQYVEVLARTGQAKFRERVFQRFGARCVFTGCDYKPALEAAHISPFTQSFDDSAENGLPLRRDVHRLFDLGEISIHVEESRVVSIPPVAERWNLMKTIDAMNWPRKTRELLTGHFQRYFEA